MAAPSRRTACAAEAHRASTLSSSDAAALKTTARRDDDDFVLNGTKQFISGAGYNDVYVVMVRTGEANSRGIRALVVEQALALLHILPLPPHLPFKSPRTPPCI